MPGLKLPSYQQLSKEQDAINNLPLDGSHLVIGPPGTGKTTMAIYRAEMYQRAQKRSHLLVYNNTLTQYLAQAMKETQISGTTSTFHKWFWHWYLKNLTRRYPETAQWEVDWDQVFIDTSRSRTYEQYDHIAIDEGQDFPPKFFMVMKLLTRNITVFADENQRLRENTNSTLEEIRQHLLLKNGQLHRLTRNYRNTRPVAEFAREFYADLSSGWPELPERTGPKPGVRRAASLDSQVRFIARYERNNADRDIAVFVLTNDEQHEVFRSLKRHGTANAIQMYVSKDENHKALDFQRRGIKILTYASAKGLEFDTVFIPNLDRRRYNPDSAHDKMQFYVLTSRPRDELYLLYCGAGLPPVLQRVKPHLYDLQDIT